MVSFNEYVQRTVEVLKGGGLVALPTETVYGLAGLVSIPEACARIFEVKRRPHFDPLIVHVASVSMLEPYVEMTRSQRLVFEKLSSVFWPGPLTIILPKSRLVPDIITAGLATVAVRSPNHPFAKAVLQELNEPFAAPSANTFGKLSPTSAAHVRESLGADNVDLIVDLPGCDAGIESTIVDLTTPLPIVRRPGAVNLEEIENILGVSVTSANLGETLGVVPGETLGHYAPDVRLKLSSVQEMLSMRENEKSSIGVLTLSTHLEGFGHCEVLSSKASYTEAASRLFGCLHRLNQSGSQLILAEQISEHGLGLAMMNRLKKAQASFSIT